MSDEISMAQKLELLRTATAKSLGVGSLGPPRTSGADSSLPDMPPFAPFEFDVRQETNRLSPSEEIPYDATGGGGAAADVPLACTYDAEAGTIAVRGAYWQDGAAGPWNILEDSPAMEGTEAYLVVEQSPALVSGPVAIQVRSDSPASILELDTSPPYRVIRAHVLLFSAADGIPKTYKTGNFTLNLEQINGSVSRWPTMCGGEPPQAPASP